MTRLLIMLITTLSIILLSAFNIQFVIFYVLCFNMIWNNCKIFIQKESVKNDPVERNVY